MDAAERFTDDDLRFVAETVAAGRYDAADAPARLRGRQDLLDVMLEDDRLVDRLLGDDQALLRVSPRLVFSVLLRRVVRDLEQRPYTVERAEDETVAVFDATQVRRFIAEPEIWHYLVSMLTSFIRNESLTVLVRRREHYVRRRFNTSSLEDMIDLLGLTGGDDVPWIFRRIGDIALFQSGIFPQSLRWAGGARNRALRPAAVPPTLASYEEQGRKFYKLAASRAMDDNGRVLGALAEEFSAARKSLELLSDRYLRWTPIRWFPGFEG
ncbi:MAG TPA: hypothetical protein VKW09_15020 [bacterium]|nr:hypothetical protein [bacterium]